MSVSTLEDGACACACAGAVVGLWKMERTWLAKSDMI